MQSLRLYEHLLKGSAFLMDLTDQAALTWRRSTRRKGGYWRGSFSLGGDPSFLAQFFYEFLGSHFEEKTGGNKTWEGILYEMDLTLGGSTRRRSLDRMSNHVKSTYIDTADAIQTSSAATNDASIARYGRREELLTLDGYDQAASEALRDTFLKENAWPWARPVGSHQGLEQNLLTVVVCGYIFTANWRYLTAGDGTDDYASDFIGEILAADCQFLQIGSIEANTLTVKKSANVPIRAYDKLNEMEDLGDASGNPWRLWVENDRRAYYRQINTAPAYYLRGGELYTSVGGSEQVNPWTIKPGVVRDLSYPVKKQEYGGWLADARDIFVDEVEVGPGGWALKTDLFEESEILAAQQAYQESLESTASASATGAGEGGSRHVWELLGMTRADRMALTPEEWQKIKRAAQKRKRETGRFKP
jgi:hypothetical protein